MLVNKLHINLGKCCYMKFKPILNTETNLEDRLIKIGETPIKARGGGGGKRFKKTEKIIIP